MNKYRAKKVTLDGFTFDSKLEARRYGELRFLEKAGKIADLTVHPTFQIFLNGVPICKVELDFRYDELGQVVYEDTKGFYNRESRLKHKLVEAQYGIKVVLVRAARR